MVEVYALNIEKNPINIGLSEFFPFVSEERKEKIRRFKNYQDALRSLYAELLVRAVICEKIRIRNNYIDIVKNDYGKPFLSSPNSPTLQFSISHSGRWVVCAFDSLPLGIDIERIKPIDLEIARRFFTREEYLDILSQPGVEGQHYFFNLWTLKESFIKLHGRGLSIPLNSFSIRILPNGKISIHMKEGLSKVFFRLYDIDENYKMSVCACRDIIPKNIKEVDLEYILKALINSS